MWHWKSPCTQVLVFHELCRSGREPGNVGDWVFLIFLFSPSLSTLIHFQYFLLFPFIFSLSFFPFLMDSFPFLFPFQYIPFHLPPLPYSSFSPKDGFHISWATSAVFFHHCMTPEWCSQLLTSDLIRPLVLEHSVWSALFFSLVTIIPLALTNFNGLKCH